jgi:hypothetical protein
MESSDAWLIKPPTDWLKALLLINNKDKNKAFISNRVL